jgi:hypothetical protein
VNELLAQGKAEERDLQQHPTLPDRDAFGGWTKGPQLQATGFFRAEKLSGKWWLVDPAGHLFFSVGIDSIGVGGGATVVTGRETMFTWVPEKNDPVFGPCVTNAGNIIAGPVKSGMCMNYQLANLLRKDGADYMNAFIDRTLRRLPSWGFNTMGNWVDPHFFGNKRIPYTPSIEIGSRGLPTVGRGMWRDMVDPFDPRFTDAARKAIAGVTAQVKDDPYCIGYFVNNEENWGRDGDYLLAVNALGMADPPRKRRGSEKPSLPHLPAEPIPWPILIKLRKT